jgi:ABC-type polysaccharide/polyol phosphate export permease
LAWGRTSLLGEKVMQTLDGMLLAPRNRLYIMFGKAVQSFVEIIITVIFFAVAIIFLQPQINLFNLLVGVLSLIFLFVIFISLDFIVSAIGLAEEGIEGFITTYVPRAFLLIGCVYYPVDVIPEFARPFVYLNPLYHAVNLFRSAFMTADLRFGFLPLVYLAILTLVLPILAAFLFDFVLRRWGIRGY